MNKQTNTHPIMVALWSALAAFADAAEAARLAGGAK